MNNEMAERSVLPGRGQQELRIYVDDFTELFFSNQQFQKNMALHGEKDNKKLHSKYNPNPKKVLLPHLTIRYYYNEHHRIHTKCSV